MEKEEVTTRFKAVENPFERLAFCQFLTDPEPIEFETWDYVLRYCESNDRFKTSLTFEERANSERVRLRVLRYWGGHAEIDLQWEAEVAREGVAEPPDWAVTNPDESNSGGWGGTLIGIELFTKTSTNRFEIRTPETNAKKRGLEGLNAWVKFWKDQIGIHPRRFWMSPVETGD